MKTFHNPVSPFDAPDPFMTYDPETGYYYALFTRGSKLELFRSRHAGQIVTDGDSKIIVTADGENDIWGDIWAPEMHRAPSGLWYIYTSSRVTREPGQKRLFIVESESSDPFGAWHFKCRPTPDVFSIDPTVYTDQNGQQYICYSRVDPNLGQVLDICPLDNPWTFGQVRTMIACAEYDWELIPPYDKSKIVEGAFFVEHAGRLYIVYSANGCWSDDYCLGVLEYIGTPGDVHAMCTAENWKKHAKPIFTKGNSVFGPGHASFFRSPDGSELWCAYHGMKQTNPTVTGAARYFNIQKIDFDENGFFVPAIPCGYECEIVPPAGEI